MPLPRCPATIPLPIRSAIALSLSSQSQSQLSVWPQCCATVTLAHLLVTGRTPGPIPIHGGRCVPAMSLSSSRLDLPCPWCGGLASGDWPAGALVCQCHAQCHAPHRCNKAAIVPCNATSKTGGWLAAALSLSHPLSVLLMPFRERCAFSGLDRAVQYYCSWECYKSSSASGCCFLVYWSTGLLLLSRHWLDSLGVCLFV
jgi:hypothetical protein